MNSVKMNLKKFYQFCEWLKKQPQPIIMTQRDVVSAYFADTGEEVSTSTVAKAVQATGVVIIRAATLDPERASKHNNRVSNLAGVLRRFVNAVEAKLKCPLLDDSDRAFLKHLNCGTLLSERASSKPE